MSDPGNLGRFVSNVVTDDAAGQEGIPCKIRPVVYAEGQPACSSESIRF